MNKRQKFIASCTNPYFGNYSTKTEVKLAKKLARGKYWNDEDFGIYVSFSPSGEQEDFHYDDSSKNIAKKAARLWAKVNVKNQN